MLLTRCPGFIAGPILGFIIVAGTSPRSVPVASCREQRPVGL
jgi:hypothetical protein